LFEKAFVTQNYLNYKQFSEFGVSKLVI